MANSGEPDQDEATKTVKVREVVAVFDRAEEYESAVDELLSSGFNRAEVSLLASEAAINEKLPHRFRRVEEMEEDKSVPVGAYVSTADIGDAEGGAVAGLAYIGATVAAGVVVASGGSLALAIGAAVASGGAGGLLGSLIAKWVGDHHAAVIEAQVEAGGLLLWVTVRDPEHERRAIEILSRYSTHDVHAHEITREWGPKDRPLSETQFDPFLTPDPHG